MTVTAGSETNVVTSANTEEFPVVVARPDGGWIVAWRMMVGVDQMNAQLQYQAYHGDGSLDGAIVTLDGLVPWGGQSGFTVTTEGRVVATSGTYPNDIYMVGTDLPETIVNTTEDFYQTHSAVTALADGGWVVTWTSDFQDGSGKSIHQQRYTADGVKSGVENQVNTYVAGEQSVSKVTAVTGGGWVVTWISNNQDGSGGGIYAQLFGSNGARIGGEQRVNESIEGNQNRQAIAPTHDGGYIATWLSTNGVVGRQFGPDGLPLAGEFSVNTAAGVSAPSVTQLVDGRFVVTWSTSGNHLVLGQVFHADGTKSGAVIQLTETSDEGRSHSSIAPLPDGGFVVVWPHWTGTNTNIHQRVFHVTDDAPTGADATIALGSSTDTHSFTLTDFGFADANDNQLESIIITTLPDKGVLTLNGDAVTAGQVIDAADIGQLLYTPATSGTAGNRVVGSFTFQLVDDGSLQGGGQNTDQSPNRLTFTQPFNDAPSGTDSWDYVLEIGQKTFTAADFGFSDSNGDNLLAVVITTLPQTGSLTLNGQAVSAGQAIAAADFANLVWTSDNDSIMAGNDSFTFQVRDDGGTPNGGHDTDATPNLIRLFVETINSAPSGTDNTFSIGENQTHAFAPADFGFSDPDDVLKPNLLGAIHIISVSGEGTLTYRGSTSFNPYVGLQPDDLVYTPASGASAGGQFILEFAVVDNGGRTNGGKDEDPTPNFITINVVSRNDAPIGADFAKTVNEDATFTFSDDMFGFSDPGDGGANALSAIRIEDIRGKGTFMLDKQAVTEGQTIDVDDLSKLTFKGDKNGFGDAYAELDFKVKDDGGTANGGSNWAEEANTLVLNVLDTVDRFNGSKGKEKLNGTSGSDILNGKAGNDTLTGQAGVDTFVFKTGYDKDVIKDFNAKGEAHDILDISGLKSVKNFNDLILNHLDSVKGGLEIDGGKGDTITLMGVKISDLDKGDFLF
jgi:hypothetical protein